MFEEEGYVGRVLEGTLVKVNGKVMETWCEEGVSYDVGHNPLADGSGTRLEMGSNWIEGERYGIESMEKSFYDVLGAKQKKVHYWSFRYREKPVAVKTKVVASEIYVTTFTLTTENGVHHIQVLHGFAINNKKQKQHWNKQTDRLIRKFMER